MVAGRIVSLYGHNLFKLPPFFLFLFFSADFAINCFPPPPSTECVSRLLTWASGCLELSITSFRC